MRRTVLRALTAVAVTAVLPLPLTHTPATG